MDFPSSYLQFSAEIEAVATRVAQARRGRLNDLASLESEVDELCRRLEAAPRQAGRAQVPALRTLVTELDLLAVDLENARRGG